MLFLELFLLFLVDPIHEIHYVDSGDTFPVRAEDRRADAGDARDTFLAGLRDSALTDSLKLREELFARAYRVRRHAGQRFRQSVRELR